MIAIAPLRNPIRHYAWGSHTALAELQGRPSPSPEPEAELWMGAHPRAPSEAWVDGRWQPLPELLARHGREILGSEVAARLGAELPFLLKVLAVARPLSLQVHPDAEQARAGFARERAAGLPAEASARHYPDPHPKTELLCALAPFDALCGLQAPAEIAERARRLGLAALEPELGRLAHAPAGRGLRDLLAAVLALAPERLAQALAQVDAARRVQRDPELAWVVRLAAQHPGDPAALAPLLLRHVHLEPGEVLHLAPGTLHAYLQGVGVELMTPSDNVVRGGLTAKAVDVAELLRLARFDAPAPRRLEAMRGAAGETIHRSPGGELELARLAVPGAAPLRREPHGRVEILLCSEGRIRVRDAAAQQQLCLARGESCLVPAVAPGYVLEGSGELHRATVPGP